MFKPISALILAGLLLTAGFVQAIYSDGEQNNKNTYSQEEELTNELNSEKNVKSVLDESITQTIEFLDTRAMPDGRYVWETSCCSVHNLETTKNFYPVELTGIVEDGTMYTVFRLNDEKIGDYYTYIFFRYINKEEAPEFNPALEDERWQIAGREVRVSKHLLSKDFENITTGATIEDVTAVDPITAISVPKEDYMGTNPVLSFDTFHYTDDGLLRITFERNTIEDEFLVSEIELDSSFEVNPFDGSDMGEELSPVKLKINPEHLPD